MASVASFVTSMPVTPPKSVSSKSPLNNGVFRSGRGELEYFNVGFPQLNAQSLREGMQAGFGR